MLHCVMELNDIVAITSWWCEGSKARRDYRWKNSYLYPIEVTNTDPKIIKAFLNLLQKRFNLPLSKIKGQLQIHIGDDKTKLENFWSNQTGIPVAQFNKTIIRKNGLRRKKSTGTFKVRVYNKELFFKLSDLLNKKIIHKIGV